MEAVCASSKKGSPQNGGKAPVSSCVARYSAEKWSVTLPLLVGDLMDTIGFGRVRRIRDLPWEALDAAIFFCVDSFIRSPLFFCRKPWHKSVRPNRAVLVGGWPGTAATVTLQAYIYILTRKGVLSIDSSAHYTISGA